MQYDYPLSDTFIAKIKRLNIIQRHHIDYTSTRPINMHHMNSNLRQFIICNLFHTISRQKTQFLIDGI